MAKANAVGPEGRGIGSGLRAYRAAPPRRLLSCRLPSSPPPSSLSPSNVFAVVVLVLGILIRDAVAAVAVTQAPSRAATGGSFIFPSSPGLVLASGALVNVTFTAPFAKPVLSLWCDEENPRREDLQRIHDPFRSWAVVELPNIEATSDETEIQCLFDLRADAPNIPSILSPMFTISTEERVDADEQMLELRDALTPSKTLLERAPVVIPSPTSQATTGPGNVPIHCPADNRTVFTDPTTLKRYVIVCDVDYHKDLGSKDMLHQETETLNSCVALCAITSGCVGVGWGDFNGYNTCWLKSLLGRPHNAVSWYFAIEDPTQPGTPPSSSTTATAGTATGAAIGASSSSNQLSGDAKAGIGVGVTVGAVLAGVAGVLIWWRYQQKKLDKRKEELLERKMEVASSNGGDGGSASSYFLQHPGHGPQTPPTRGSSYRSDSHAHIYGAPGAGLGIANTNDDVYHHNTSPSNHHLNPQHHHHHPTHDHHNNPSSFGISTTDLSVRPTTAAPSEESPHLAHVALYIQQQAAKAQLHQQQQQQQNYASNIQTTTLPSQAPVAHDLEHAAKAAAAFSAAGAPPSSTLLSSTIATPSSGSILIAPPWSTAAASELPVREGYQGYGPEYEMAAMGPGPPGSFPGQVMPFPRAPHRPPGGREVDEQKFLLADMLGAGAKVRVLRPEDRHELG